MTTALVLCFFQVLPHYPVGVSEVHFILGSTLFLLFGGGATAIGLALGLLIQGVLFAPFDLPQYGMNVTTILVPLWAVGLLAKRMIAPDTAYVDLKYAQAVALSTAYQAGVVGWVALWAFLRSRLRCGKTWRQQPRSAEPTCWLCLLEPLADLAVLSGAKTMRSWSATGLFYNRLHRSAA